MTFVVTDNCKNCKYTDCVVVCPVDCFYADGNMVYIDPEECIDCVNCVEECPVNAIYAEEELPEELHHWLGINKEKCENRDTNGLYHITEKEEPLPTAEPKRKELGL